MSKPASAGSVLFSDVVGSSKLYQKLGNAKAEKKIHFIIQTLSECTERYAGRVIKTIGDEIMCSFNDLSDAADAASEMNRLVHDSQIELRTGISYGELVERDGDVFGDVVNNAAFLTKLARAREILIDEHALDTAGGIPSRKIELIAEMEIKGLDEACKIYRFNWETKIGQTMGATLIDHSGAKSDAQNTLLILDHEGEQLKISSEKPAVVVGRDKSSTSLRIAHAKISRRHCTILYKQGKFVLEDHSTNGTFVIRSDSEITSVHRESFALIGQGSLYLGAEDAPQQCIIHYSVK